MWSNEGSPIKRQEHVQFSEYLSMDRYKHDSSTPRTQKVRCAPKTIKAESFDDSIEKPTANGTGEFGILSLKWWILAFSHLCIVLFCLSCDAEHHNNNKPFTNGTCSSMFLHSGVKNPFGLTYDYRYKQASIILNFVFFDETPTLNDKEQNLPDGSTSVF